MNKVTAFPKPAQPITGDRRPVDMTNLDDVTLVIVLCDAVHEVKNRARDLRMHSTSDAQGRTWSMSAILRHLIHVMNHIQATVGK